MERDSICELKYHLALSLTIAEPRQLWKNGIILLKKWCVIYNTQYAVNLCVVGTWANIPFNWLYDQQSLSAEAMRPCREVWSHLAFTRYVIILTWPGTLVDNLPSFQMPMPSSTLVSISCVSNIQPLIWPKIHGLKVLGHGLIDLYLQVSSKTLTSASLCLAHIWRQCHP
jgi:hypothetical protein